MRKFYKLFSGLGILLTSLSLNAQVLVNENFNSSSTPTGWVANGFASNSTAPCEGSYSMRRNFWSLATTGDLRSPFQTATGDDIAISFDYKIVQYHASNPTVAQSGNWGTMLVQYSVDGGANWITHHTINQSNHVAAATCTNVALMIPGASVPNMSNFAVRFNGSWATGDYLFYIDKVSIIEQVPCPRPTALTLGTVNSNSANISWTAGSTETSWNIEWGATGFTPGTGTSIGSDVVSSNSKLISGLTSATNFQVYVQADCGGSLGQSTWAGPFSFSTTQIPVTLPFTDDFSTSEWILNNGSQPNKWAIGSAAGNPANGLYISNDNGVTNSYDISVASVTHAVKLFTLPAGTNSFNFSFQWKAGGEGSSDYLRVWLLPATVTGNPVAGTQISTTNLTGAVQLTSSNLNLTPNWTLANYTIPASHAGTNVRIVFEWRNDGSVGVQPPAAIDNISFKENTCPVPTAFASSNTTSNSVDFTWTAGGSETAWDIQWGPVGFMPGLSQIGSNTVSGTATTTVGGLSNGVNYQFYVRANCGSGSESRWVGPILITTIQTPVAIPYTDDFSSSNWVLNNGNQASNWVVGSATGNPANSLYVSNDNGVTNNYTTISSTTIHALKAFTLPSGTNPFSFSFQWKSGGEGSSDYLRVWLLPATVTGNPVAGTQISTTNLTGAVQLNSSNLNLNSNWTLADYTIPASHAGTNVRIVFEWRNDGSGGTQPAVAIDNVALTEITCLVPTLFASSNPTINSVDLAWKAGNNETSWNVQWGLTGFIPGSGTPVGTDVVTDTFLTVNGLTDLTTYHFYVQADCGPGDLSTWVGPISATTLQIPATIPFADDFSSNGWVLGNGTQTNKWYVGSATGNPANSLYVTNDNGVTNAYTNSSSQAVHATKLITFPTGSPFDLSFDWKSNGEAGYDYLRVWLIPANAVLTPGTQIPTTPVPAGYYQLGANHEENLAWTTSNYVIPSSFAGTTSKLVFEWRNDGSGGTNPPAAVDNISITQQTCGDPSNVVISTLDLNSATISWLAGNDETEWNVSWGRPGYVFGDTNEISSQVVTDTFVNITGLTANTNYQFYVQADCDISGVSSWVGPFNFYTGYCTAGTTSSTYFINNFSTTGAAVNISNLTSGYSTGGYSNVTSTGLTHVPGGQFSFSTTFNNSTNTFGVAIWVDWNNNMVFEASERVFNTTAYTSNATGTITIPTSVTPGSYRMRVVANYNLANPINPCASFTNGEIEDYTVTIISAPVSPVPTQVAGTPDCIVGTDIETTGTPGVDETWYWQTSATGTDVTMDASTPWTVFENATYYVRTLNTLYNIWSVADSIIITNVPLATTPPAPIAAQNPACVPGTDLTVPAATGSVKYYWQGTSNTSSLTTNDAVNPFTVTTTGTYYVKAKDTVSGCWSLPVGTLVTIQTELPAAAVANPASYNFCLTDSPMNISVQTSAAANNTCSISATASGYDDDNFAASVTDFSCATGPIVSATLDADLEDYFGCLFEYYSYDIVVNGVTVAIDRCSNTAFNLTPYLPLTSVQIVSRDLDFDSDLMSLYLTVNLSYTTALPTVNWFDAATGGSNVGSGDTIDVLGTTIIPTATSGTYSFYAETQAGACPSATRTLVTVNLSGINVTLAPVAVTCNNGNDGTINVTDTLCGVAPFTYSVNGGAYGALPTDLTPGTYSITVKDANDEVSSAHTVVIPNGQAPSGLIVNSTTDTQINVSWVANGSETSWNIEWGLPGFTPGTGAQLGAGTANDTTFVITGLTENTEYVVYVSANCGGTTTPGTWINRPVKTACSIFAIPFIESFEDNSTSRDCWTNNHVTGTANWTIATGSTATVTTAYEGTKNARFVSQSGTDTPITKFVTPMVNVSGHDSLALIFAYAQPVWSGDQNRTKVYVRSEQDANWIEIASYTANVSAWRVDTLMVHPTGDTLYVAFEGINNYGRANVIDNVQLLPCIVNPGTDGTANVCTANSTIDLNTVITAGETWGRWVYPANQSLISGSTFNFATLADGVYEVYYVVQTPCTSDTTVATVTVSNATNAGTDGLINACKNQTIDLSTVITGTITPGGTWYRNNGTALTTSTVQSGTLVGQFQYKYIVSNGACAADTSVATINVQNCDVLGLDVNSILENVSVAPNPNNGNFQILGISNLDYTFEVLDLNGRIVRNNSKITSSKTDVDLTDVENGVYMIRIMGNGSERMIRVVKH